MCDDEVTVTGVTLKNKLSKKILSIPARFQFPFLNIQKNQLG